MKTIGIPTNDQYRRCLINKTESVVHRMRWKANFYVNGNNGTEKGGKFGLPSKKCGPPVKEMKGFEEDLIKLISEVSFLNVNDPFLKQVNEDIKNVNSSKNVFVFADKTTNVYETDP